MPASVQTSQKKRPFLAELLWRCFRCGQKDCFLSALLWRNLFSVRTKRPFLSTGRFVTTLPWRKLFSVRTKRQFGADKKFVFVCSLHGKLFLVRTGQLMKKNFFLPCGQKRPFCPHGKKAVFSMRTKKPFLSSRRISMVVLSAHYSPFYPHRC